MNEANSSVEVDIDSEIDSSGESLKAYAIELQFFAGLEHTYVTSSDGKKWGCWGRDAGGRIIASCQPFVAASGKAACIAGQDSHAGIRYGITGVCHQTANRILWPSAMIVSRAHGYTATSLAYGAYGLDPGDWIPIRNRCCPAPTAASSRPQATIRKTESSPEQKFAERIFQLYEKEAVKPRAVGVDEENANRTNLLAQELDLTLDYRLGEDGITEHERELLKAEQVILIAKMDNLRGSFARKEIPASAYMVAANSMFFAALSTTAKLLGQSAYERLFGMSIDQKPNLIDPDIMRSAYPQSF